jgi:hypothetical protein
MPIVIPSGYAQLTTRMALASSTQTAECVFGVNFDDPADCVQVLDAWAAEIMPLVCSNWTYVYGMARVQAGLITEKIYTTAGTGGATPAPPNVAVLARKVTSLPGRANKGRMYIPGPLETNIDGTGLMTAGTIASYDSRFTNFLAAIAAAPAGGFGLMVILHNQSVSTPAPTNVDQLKCMQLVATQRRRLRG